MERTPEEQARIDKMKVITFANQKGGVAKTTNSINLAYVLANNMNMKVLLVDMDSQGNASTCFGIDITKEDTNTIDRLLLKYLEDKKVPGWDEIKKYIYEPEYEAPIRNPENPMKWITGKKSFNVDVIPASLDLAVVEFQLMLASSKGQLYPGFLRDILEQIALNTDYDIVVIDTPPALGMLSINSIYAARDGVIIPTNLDLLSFQGIDPCLDTVNSVMSLCRKRGLKHSGAIGILRCAYGRASQLDMDLTDYIRRFYPTYVFKQEIPNSRDAIKANAQKKLFAQVSKKGEEAFNAVAAEVLDILAANDNRERKMDFDIDTLGDSINS